MRAGLAVVGAVLALGACGRFGVDDSPATPSDDAGVVVPKSDGGAANDGASDVPPPDAGPPHFCADAGVDFCEDWETDTSSLWDPGNSDGTVMRDTQRPHSDTFSLDSMAPANTKARAVLSHRIDTKKRKGSLSAWVWVEDWAGDQPVTILQLDMEPSDGSAARVMVQFTGDASDNDWKLKLVTQHDSTDSSSSPNQVKIVRQTWIKVTLDFDVDASKMTLTEDVGPEPSTFTVTAVTYGDQLPIDDYQIRVGASLLNDTSPSVHIYIDDITLTLR